MALQKSGRSNREQLLKIQATSLRGRPLANYAFRNLRIEHQGADKTEAVICAHGGYTPRRGLLRGSGTSTVPGGVTLIFYTAPNAACIGTRAAWILNGDPAPDSMPPTPAGTAVENLSLTHHPAVIGYSAALMDVIRVAPGDGIKAHMNDIWDARNAIANCKWTTVHCFACRVNKLTFEF
jgi:hypothetical protein